MSNPVDDLREQVEREMREQGVSEWLTAANVARGFFAPLVAARDAEIERLRRTFSTEYDTNCEARADLSTLDRWLGERTSERDAAEASRRDWAAEAMGLEDASKSLEWLSVFGHGHRDFRRCCACITDEQATQLGPGFSRPVCAVHPVEDGA